MGVISEMGSGGAPGFKFEKVGASIVGRVISIETQQDHLFQKPEKLLWWNRDPGPATNPPSSADRPKMVFVFTVATELNDGTEEDNGERAIWCRGNLHTAVREAIEEGVGKRTKDMSDDDVIGGTLKIQHYALGKATKGNPPKLFRAKFEPPAVVSSMDDDATETASPSEPDGRPAPPMDW